MGNDLLCSRCKNQLSDGEKVDQPSGMTMYSFFMRRINGEKEHLCLPCVEALGIKHEFVVKGGNY